MKACKKVKGREIEGSHYETRLVHNHEVRFFCFIILNLEVAGKVGVEMEVCFDASKVTKSSIETSGKLVERRG